MHKKKVKGIWQIIFSDKEKGQVYDEQKQGMSKAEKKIYNKEPTTTPFKKKKR
tara:strand:- start:317 stop:475 length:159 start_codon:yes stop_codon:yes gene_type:complete